jgi:uncharacterized protein (TIGR03435 family)
MILRRIFYVLALVTAAGLCQALGQTAGPEPAFDVATIKPSHATDGHSHIYNHAEIGEFSTINVSLKGLMEFAYELPETRMVGGTAWLDSAKFDIQAKTDSQQAARLKSLSFNQATAEIRRMVQALLADRFQLKMHDETRELPIYTLVVAKGGAQLGEVQSNGTTISLGRDHLEVQGNDSVALLAEQLAKLLGRVVVDRTGITGRYDIKLKWAPDDSTDASGPSIYTALQEQIGLKLEAGKGPVKVLVIDRVQQPSEN